jgi:hypothetical protein
MRKAEKGNEEGRAKGTAEYTEYAEEEGEEEGRRKNAEGEGTKWKVGGLRGFPYSLLPVFSMGLKLYS